jgi:hypothetical protein
LRWRARRAGRTLHRYFFQALGQLLDALRKQAAIEFELGFAGTAQTDRTTALRSR